MRGPHNIWRLIRTGATFERTGAMAVVLEAMEAPARLRFAARMLGWPFKWLGVKGDPALPPVTRALTALGPAYIKFGQILSTRPDIVGEELAEQAVATEIRLAADDRQVRMRKMRAECRHRRADAADLRRAVEGRAAFVVQHIDAEACEEAAGRVQFPRHRDRVAFVREWKRRDWGGGGEDFHWWCTDDPSAFVGKEPVYKYLKDEIVELVGLPVYKKLVALLEEKRSTPLPHPKVRR